MFGGMSSLTQVLHVYPVSNYTFGSKTAKPEKDRSVTEMFARMQMRCVPAVLSPLE